MGTSLRARAETVIIPAAMERWSKRVMEWGVDDCMLSVADIVSELTGSDPAVAYRGRYKTRSGARHALGKGGVLQAALTAAADKNWKPIEPMAARAGDVGLIEIVIKRSKGRKPVTDYVATICRAPGWFIVRSAAGFTVLPAVKVTKAWAIA